MPRRTQPRGKKGSLKWIQLLVNDHPGVLESAIAAGSIEWLSPLASDDFAEYWDEDALDLLDLSLPTRGLRDFWPRSGPRWDALGRAAGGVPILVEAKSHALELTSSSAAGEDSLATIRAALAETATALGARYTRAWSDGYYQYANRLAHAYLFNVLNDAPAHIVFLHFVGDREMDGPETKEEWIAINSRVHGALGFGSDLPPFVRHAYVDVSTGLPVPA